MAGKMLQRHPSPRVYVTNTHVLAFGNSTFTYKADAAAGYDLVAVLHPDSGLRKGASNVLERWKILNMKNSRRQDKTLEEGFFYYM